MPEWKDKNSYMYISLILETYLLLISLPFNPQN